MPRRRIRSGRVASGTAGLLATAALVAVLVLIVRSMSSGPLPAGPLDPVRSGGAGRECVTRVQPGQVWAIGVYQADLPQQGHPLVIDAVDVAGRRNVVVHAVDVTTGVGIGLISALGPPAEGGPAAARTWSARQRVGPVTIPAHRSVGTVSFVVEASLGPAGPDGGFAHATVRYHRGREHFAFSTALGGELTSGQECNT